MKLHHYRMFVIAVALLTALSSNSLTAQQPAADPAAQSYMVFLRSRPVGREEVAVVRQADGWIVRGSNRLGPPLDAITRLVEIHYDGSWRPTRMTVDGTSRGQDVSITTTFAGGKAITEISMAGTTTKKEDAVAADTIVLPNALLGSYAALAQRLVGATAGATLRGYIAPQAEIPIRVDGVFAERIETPQRAIAATRYSLILTNPPPAGDLQVSLWTDPNGALLRMSVPAQTLELAREDIASAATRTAAFSLPGDEPVRIPSAGFNLAASVTKPAHATERLPALILIGGSGATDRDGFVAGIPLLGQMAREFVDAGFLVVRYDKRGVGQSGGRTEASTLADYAEDVRSIVTWLEKRRKDVDKNRIGIVGHSEGASVAMLAAARDKRIKAVALIAGPSSTGAELVLEQQRRLLERMKLPDAERDAKIELQKRIHAAVATGTGWDEIPDDLRRAADTPWFQSLLAFDPVKVMKDVRQPLLIIQGELDTQVPPHHAERLAELARARKRKVSVDVAKIPGVNHLMVAAKTGEVDEYALLTDQQISTAATSAIASWMARTMGSL